MAESAFLAIALYHVIELHFLLFSTFLRKRSFYFWAVLGATWGVALNGLGAMLNAFILRPNSPSAYVIPVTVMMTIGWYLMVTGQSLVLFSRLHLVVSNRNIIRGVLVSIIVTFLTLHVPITVIVFLQVKDTTGRYAKIFKHYEPIQLTIFTVQEVAISVIYIYSAAKILRPIQTMRGKKVKATIWNLIYINVFIIAMDIAVINIEYAHLNELQHFFKACVYSVKLKIEFVVLNQLLELMQKRNAGQPLHRFEQMHDSTSKEKSLEGIEMAVTVDVTSSNIRSPGPLPKSQIDHPKF